MSNRVSKRSTSSSVRRQALLTSIESFGSVVMPCQRCTDRGLVCKKLPDHAKCGECVRSARPCEEIDYDAELVRMAAENEKLKREHASLLKAMQDHVLPFLQTAQDQILRLAEVQRRQEELAAKTRDVSRAAMAELEVWEEEDRAAGREPEPLREERPAEASTSSAPAPVDWSSLGVSAYPPSWLGSPSPLADPGSSGGIPPASQGNLNS
ncbi:hypothetical protein N0V85_008716 [Neurospora sp. IMI 360204]|nr:hypothetical protein N0V85_008716 [Neurospora sp. IMI 360204]